jgi:hypothetical protein
MRAAIAAASMLLVILSGRNGATSIPENVDLSP